MSKRAWHPSVVPVIPIQSVPHLENYKFTPAHQGCIDNFLTKYLWNVIARALPPNVHPNVITFIGFIFMTFAFAVSALLVAGWFNRRPACIYLTLAFCVFMYMTCDAVDGIVARKLGVSSPLGQFLDHGFDTIYTFLWPVFFLVIFDCGFNVFFHVQLFGVFIQLAMVMVKEQEKGVFYCHNNIVGVTHAHLLTIFGLILRAVYGEKFGYVLIRSTNVGKIVFGTFLAKVIPQQCNLYQLILFSGVLFYVVTIMVDMITSFRLLKQKVAMCKVLGSALFHFLFIYAVHCWKPLAKGGFFSKPALPFKLRLVMFAFTIMCFITIGFRNLISVICKVPMVPFFVHLAPVYLFLFIYYLKFVVGIAIPKIDVLLTAYDKLIIVFAVVTIYCALFVLHHFVCVVLEIKNLLGLSIFYVKPRVSSARKF